MCKVVYEKSSKEQKKKRVRKVANNYARKYDGKLARDKARKYAKM